jgi:integrase
VWPYTTKAGQQRYAIGFVKPDGTSVTRRRGMAGERWTAYKDAARALAQIQQLIEDGEYADPSRQRVGAFLDEWLDGLRLAPSTVASYRRNVRLHIKPYIGGEQLTRLTATKIDVLYRRLEREGRADEPGGLSARTVRYIHTILQAALKAAVEAGLLRHNPAAKAHPPTAKQATAPEMQCWTAEQLAAFLGWLRTSGHQHGAAWTVLALTGMRRGECLALRWRDADLDAATVSVRRSVGIIRDPAGRELLEGPTKTGKPRVVDLGAEAVGALRAHRRARGAMALQLVRDDALVFADHEGRHLHPEHFSRSFTGAVNRANASHGLDLPVIRLHDLRHTHATLLLSDGEQLKVVSERLGHASATITLNTYSHVLPGGQRAAAARFDRLIGGGAS